MIDKKRLFDAANFAMDEWPMINGVTYCNFGVYHIVEKFGYNFYNIKRRRKMLANEIIQDMERDNSWYKISSRKAFRYMTGNNAKTFLIIAGVREAPHGHVAVLCPRNTRKQIYSGKWKRAVPYCFNVGHKNGIMGVNWAFRNEPRYWVYS